MAVSHVAVYHVAVFLAVDGDTVRVGAKIGVGVGVRVRRPGETDTWETAMWILTQN